MDALKKRKGLANQGATCYLNSLLQTLFYDVDIRAAIMTAQTGDNDVLVAAMQGLFARLMLSTEAAVKTTQLVAAFGWSRAQVFEQHDLQELFTILVDSLGEAAPELGSRLKALCQGSVDEHLQCPECGFKRTGTSPFINISLELPLLPTAPEDLSALLAQHMKPEVLDADNKWTCSGCNVSVQACKSARYTTLPSSLFIHLKRFRYNLTLNRREKVTTPVAFPAVLDASVLVGDAALDPETCAPDSNQYELQGVLLHTGTANGGHYKSLNRDGDVWVECNDASVKELSRREAASLFLAPPLEEGPNGPEAAAIEGRTSSSSGDGPAERRFVTLRDDMVKESVYMLLYKRIAVGSDTAQNRAAELRAACINAVAADVRAAIEVETKQAEEALRLHEIHQHTATLKVVFRRAAGAGASQTHHRTTLSAVTTETLAAVLVRAVAQCNQEFSLALSADPAFTRLRLFDEGRGRPGDTFGADGRADKTLEALGFKGAGAVTTMLLEVRGEADPPFSEHNAREMRLRVLVWGGGVHAALGASDALLHRLSDGALDADALLLEEDAAGEPSNGALAAALPVLTGATLEVLVPGEEHATVGGLRAEVAARCGCAAADVALVQSSDRGTAELAVEDDMKGLRKNFALWPGDLIFAEVLPAEGAGTGAGESDGVPRQSAALLALRQMRHFIRVQFNDPRGPPATAADVTADGAAGDVYTHSVRALSETTTLADLKALIAAELGFLHDYLFHARGAQFKDENKTLGQLGLTNMAVLHLLAGQGCAVGEHVVKFECEVAGGAEGHKGKAGAAAVALGELVVNEKWTVRQLKEHLVKQWGTFDTAVVAAAAAAAAWPGGVPASAAHLRLRDGKAAGSALGSLLRDDRVLCRCLLGLTDGRKIAVFPLSEPEQIGPQDWILSVCVATYSDPPTVAAAAATATDAAADGGAPVAPGRYACLDAASNARDRPHIEAPHPPSRYAAKRVHRAVDVPIARTATVQQLYQKLLEVFPHLNILPAPGPGSVGTGAEAEVEASAPPPEPVVPEARRLSVAKGYASGPPMALKETLKLDWDAALASASEPLNTPAVGLRDGAVLIVRGAADYARAAGDLSALAAPGATGATKGLAPGGSGRAGAVPPWKARSKAGVGEAAGGEDRVVAGGAGGSRAPQRRPEKGISIAVSRPSANLKSAQQLALAVSVDADVDAGAGAALPPTSPSPNKENLPQNFQVQHGKDGDSMPVAPVRMVSSLRGNAVDGEAV